jgi:ABC-type dipeptide/oligopeptide/nickel transport system ATPase component
MTQLLEIKNLTTRFYTDEGVVNAVNGISYDMKEGETLGVVGESGCGKSVHALSIMRLIPSPPGNQRCAMCAGQRSPWYFKIQ